ncbi:MAG: YHS domain-containing (seleno)protein [Chitinophagaceae bacterium]
MKSIANAFKADGFKRRKMGKTLFSQISPAGLIMLITIIITGCMSSPKPQAGKAFNNVDENGVILDGYDPVAFFTDNKPVKGEEQFRFTYDEAVYHFASKEHLDRFKANPEKYKPQFGGWCAYAVSLGRVAPINVNTFSIVDGRLFIQHNQRAVNGWNKDVPGNIILADKYWPQVSGKKGAQITTDAEKGFVNNTNDNGVILQGYDAVAYFAKMKAIKGDAKYFARYNGATYWFSSETNTTMFKDHPDMFAPQYGAFSGYGISRNKLEPADPELFQIADGHLILHRSQDDLMLFNSDLPGNISKANIYWPELVKINAGKKIVYDKDILVNNVSK